MQSRIAFTRRKKKNVFRKIISLSHPPLFSVVIFLTLFIVPIILIIFSAPLLFSYWNIVIPWITKSMRTSGTCQRLPIEDELSFGTIKVFRCPCKVDKLIVLAPLWLNLRWKITLHYEAENIAKKVFISLIKTDLFCHVNATRFYKRI